MNTNDKKDKTEAEEVAPQQLSLSLAEMVSKAPPPFPKTIHTLVDDIYKLLVTGTKSPNQEYLIGMAVAIMDGVKKQLWSATSDKPPTLRMSNIGKPCVRSLWYEIKGNVKGEPLSPETKLKFMVGDIVEAVILYLAREAGHSVTHQQREIQIDGIRGHIDAIIDGELVDVKSTSSIGMKKFADGSLAEDDPFGYISQISGYANALGKKSGTFLAVDKSNGDLVTYTHTEIEDTSAKIAKVKEALTKDNPPERPFVPSYDKTANRKKLGINCSYCSFKEHCWAEPGLDIQFKSGKPVFYLKDKGNDFSF